MSAVELPPSSSRHVSIMPSEVLENLFKELKMRDFSPENPGVILDATLGGGGHTRLFLQKIKDENLPLVVVGCDQDQVAVERASAELKLDVEARRLMLIHTRFGLVNESLLADSHVKLSNVRVVFADLGFSSDQIEDGERGLSFQQDGPLDMRLGQTRETLFERLQSTDEEELTYIFNEYGEERFAKPLARALMSAIRLRQLPDSTKALSQLILGVLPGWAKKGRIHGATRAFQALRIWTNDEMGELDRLLEFSKSLSPGARAGFLTFHETEDRRVKLAFKDAEVWERMTKKALQPTRQEITLNPRSRSAKLRVAERVAQGNGRGPKRNKYRL